MEKIKIKLTQDAYVEGYKGAFYRFTTDEGKSSACGIWDNWYTAQAVDESGKTYRVVWEITDYDAFENGDEDCCNWTDPAEVIDDETGMPVTDMIKLVDKL